MTMGLLQPLVKSRSRQSCKQSVGSRIIAQGKLDRIHVDNGPAADKARYRLDQVVVNAVGVTGVELPAEPAKRAMVEHGKEVGKRCPVPAAHPELNESMETFFQLLKCNGPVRLIAIPVCQRFKFTNGTVERKMIFQHFRQKAHFTSTRCDMRFGVC